ncbi:hypothetical protein HOO68_04705 [Candidatus Gracilibacteria bacterium]|nr:hypothetical protein [Candidatus Gracilibacteria bacterium]
MENIFDFMKHHESAGVNFDTSAYSIELCEGGGLKLWGLTQEKPDFTPLEYIHFLYWNRYIDPEDVKIFGAIKNNKINDYIQTFSSGYLKWKKYNTKAIFDNIENIKKLTYPDTVLQISAKMSGKDFRAQLGIDSRKHYQFGGIPRNQAIWDLWTSIKQQTGGNPFYEGIIEIGFSGDYLYDGILGNIIYFLNELSFSHHLHVDKICYNDYRIHIILSDIHNLNEGLFLKDHEDIIYSIDFKEDKVLINGFKFELNRKFIYGEAFILICKYFNFFNVKEVGFSDLYSFLEEHIKEFKKLGTKNCIQENFYRNYIGDINSAFQKIYGLELLDMKGSLIKAKDMVGRKKKHPEEN